MGLEAQCEAVVGRKRAAGKARLESQALSFRGGELRLEVPLGEVKSVGARGGRLEIVWSGGTAALGLASQAEAEKWALKIRYPRSLMDKLGVKPGQRVSVIGVADRALLGELRARVPEATIGGAAKDSELVLVGMDAASQLGRLDSLRRSIVANGAIWVIWPKGRREFREDDVRAYGPRAGLVDVKVVSVSDTLSGLKLMIPKSLRPK